ncbi:hypothetical protein [Variovorax saccharolyticus]|uniref:hypothetical protein n=1 Tax=Variovorax saccharolyticus TaxID=3053516 RepID=UPI002576488F|nr:hypothetical protein [Variovorax sp. J31P216]MDM0030390.1 hypothetical protein [Variovorax sp. J31P216]
MPNNRSSKSSPSVFGLPNIGAAKPLDDEWASRVDIAGRSREVVRTANAINRCAGRRIDVLAGEVLPGRMLSMRLGAEVSEEKIENFLPSMRFKASGVRHGEQHPFCLIAHCVPAIEARTRCQVVRHAEQQQQ